MNADPRTPEGVQLYLEQLIAAEVPDDLIVRITELVGVGMATWDVAAWVGREVPSGLVGLHPLGRPDLWVLGACATPTSTTQADVELFWWPEAVDELERVLALAVDRYRDELT